MARKPTKPAKSSSSTTPKTKEPGKLIFYLHQFKEMINEVQLALLVHELGSKSPKLQEKFTDAHQGRGLGRSEVGRVLLKTVLDKSDQATRRIAAQALRQVGPPLGWSDGHTLLQALQDRDDEVRSVAACCLAHYEASDKLQVIGAVQKAINDPNPEVSKAAIQALRPLGPDIASAAVPAIIKVLKGPPSVQQEAIKALAWFGSEATEAIPSLIRLIHEDPADPVRIDAGRALMAIDPDGRILLTRMGAVQGKTARESLLVVLREIGAGAGALRRALQQHWRSGRRGPKEGSPDQLATPHPDGPDEPDQFWWQGKAYDIPSIPCKFLIAIWGKDKVKIEDVTEAVWRMEDASENMIKSALNDLNKVLLEEKKGFIVKK